MQIPDPHRYPLSRFRQNFGVELGKSPGANIGPIPLIHKRVNFSLLMSLGTRCARFASIASASIKIAE